MTHPNWICKCEIWWEMKSYLRWDLNMFSCWQSGASLCTSMSLCVWTSTVWDHFCIRHANSVERALDNNLKAYETDFISLIENMYKYIDRHYVRTCMNGIKTAIFRKRFYTFLYYFYLPFFIFIFQLRVMNRGMLIKFSIFSDPSPSPQSLLGALHL